MATTTPKKAANPTVASAMRTKRVALRIRTIIGGFYVFKAWSFPILQIVLMLAICQLDTVVGRDSEEKHDTLRIFRPDTHGEVTANSASNAKAKVSKRGFNCTGKTIPFPPETQFNLPLATLASAYPPQCSPACTGACAGIGDACCGEVGGCNCCGWLATAPIDCCTVNPNQCCNEGTTCCNGGGVAQRCCTPGVEQCFAPGVDCCMPAQVCNIPGGQDVCCGNPLNSVCVPPNAVYPPPWPGGCCDPHRACATIAGQTCCVAPFVCVPVYDGAYSGCFEPQEVCAGPPGQPPVGCPSGTVCTGSGTPDYTCCPGLRACGQVCCAEGSQCGNSEYGICCPAGQAACITSPAGSPPTWTCCAPGISCLPIGFPAPTYDVCCDPNAPQQYLNCGNGWCCPGLMPCGSVLPGFHCLVSDMNQRPPFGNLNARTGTERPDSLAQPQAETPESASTTARGPATPSKAREAEGATAEPVDSDTSS